MAGIGRSHTASSVVHPTVPTSADGAASDGISQEPALGERCSALMPELEEYISYVRDRVVKAEELIREINARPIQETRPVVWAVLLDVLQDDPDSWSIYKNLGVTNLIINAVLAWKSSEEVQATDKSRNVCAPPFATRTTCSRTLIRASPTGARLFDAWRSFPVWC